LDDKVTRGIETGRGVSMGEVCEYGGYEQWQGREKTNPCRVMMESARSGEMFAKSFFFGRALGLYGGAPMMCVEKTVRERIFPFLLSFEVSDDALFVDYPFLVNCA
jgi:hypothetical protein